MLVELYNIDKQKLLREPESTVNTVGVGDPSVFEIAAKDFGINTEKTLFERAEKGGFRKVRVCPTDVPHTYYQETSTRIADGSYQVSGRTLVRRRSDIDESFVKDNYIV